MPKFIIKTFGCKTNQYESEGIRESLIPAGWSEASCITDADVAIINTCTVTSRAGASARNAIRKLRRTNPKLRIILTGCAVDVADKWINDLEIDKVFKNTEKHQICQYLSTPTDIEIVQGTGFDFSIDSFHGHTRAFLKIHDGCDNYCSYCIIPYARGVPRSRAPEDIITEATRLSLNGYHELVLTGINIGAYNHSDITLAQLAGKLSEIPGISRIRLGSVEPIYLTEELLKTVRDNAKICPHLHLPLQSGSNAVLKAMNRKYTVEDFLHCIELSRSILDKPAITTDIIVGFPTEDDTSFQETLNTVGEAGFARSHIFLFSPRDGTPAASMKRPPQRDADQRRLTLEELTSAQAREYSRSLIGFSYETLMIEKVEDNIACGYLERYIRAEVELHKDKHIIKSKSYNVKIQSLKDKTPDAQTDSENTVICKLSH